VEERKIAFNDVKSVEPAFLLALERGQAAVAIARLNYGGSAVERCVSGLMG
jgi:hypothetical protein